MAQDSWLAACRQPSVSATQFVMARKLVAVVSGLRLRWGWCGSVAARSRFSWSNSPKGSTGTNQVVQTQATNFPTAMPSQAQPAVVRSATPDRKIQSHGLIDKAAKTVTDLQRQQRPKQIVLSSLILSSNERKKKKKRQAFSKDETVSSSWRNDVTPVITWTGSVTLKTDAVSYSETPKPSHIGHLLPLSVTATNSDSSSLRLDISCKLRVSMTFCRTYETLQTP